MRALSMCLAAKTHIENAGSFPFGAVGHADTAEGAFRQLRAVAEEAEHLQLASQPLPEPSVRIMGGVVAVWGSTPQGAW